MYKKSVDHLLGRKIQILYEFCSICENSIVGVKRLPKTRRQGKEEKKNEKRIEQAGWGEKIKRKREKGEEKGGDNVKELMDKRNEKKKKEKKKKGGTHKKGEGKQGNKNI